MSIKRKTGEEVAQQVTDFINSASLEEIENFVNTMTTEHRTLQNESFKLFLKCVRVWAKDYRNGNYDPRNESACLLSHKFMETLEL